MEKDIKFKVLDSIGKVYEESEKCKLENSFFSKIDTELSFLADYFKTSKSQSFFIAVVFALNYKADSVDMKDLVDHLHCNPMKLLEYSDDFNYLHSCGIFKKHKSKFRNRYSAISEDQFTIHEKIKEAIVQNQSMPELGESKMTDIFELLDKLYKLSEMRNDQEITTRELFTQVKELLQISLHFPLIQKIDVLDLNIDDAYLYLYLIWNTLSGKEKTDVRISLEDIYDSATQQVRYMQRLLFGDNVLVKNNLIEIVEAFFINDAEMKLTDNSVNLLKDCGINLFLKQQKNDNVMLPSDIPYRKLIFSKSEMEQLFVLKDLLEEKKFKKTQQRLTEKNLPKGVTVLLHGSPGTGKTEIVKQIAKETNRKIVKVEISQSKSVWFGESEKIIKRIFTDYNSFAKDCEQTPILLFNEADAVISMRREVGSSNIAQTENAIQNIILEELENFEGILIATTNLASNLDSAFERRFLFKIQFKKPDISNRAKIWKSKFSFLKLDECAQLAEKFDFSGGQIDNISRKNEIHEIIYGEKGTLDKLFIFCSEETIASNRMRIGFSKS